MLDIVIFNVEHGQCIFIFPRDAPAYGMLVDCGNTTAFHPVDQIIAWKLLPQDPDGTYRLSNLTITNYDHDHFSGLPYLRQRAAITTVRLAKNISSQELKATKPEVTEALQHLCYMKDTYIHPSPGHTPPYTVQTFSLTRDCYPAGQCDTNNLSQIVFISYGGSTICICGDLEASGWAQLLSRQDFCNALAVTNVFVAAHHGRENGHAEEVFNYCSPECIVLSDKEIVHGTQEGMAQAYANRVAGNGVRLGSQPNSPPRKVLTTRNDGHIWVRFTTTAGREYRNIV